jgi:ketosteroid isomerase-like protein
VGGCTSAAEKRENERIKALVVDAAAERRAVSDRLDSFHSAAAAADYAAYTACFAPDLIFLGTDPGERWNNAEFSSFAKSYFDVGKGWTYTLVPGSRNVSVDQSGSVAWFDEMLDSEKYGVCRGTGVARKIGGGWHLAQYSLSFPVLNEVADRVVQINRAAAKASGGGGQRGGGR